MDKPKYDRRVIEDFRFLDNVGSELVDGKNFLTINGEIVNATGVMSRSFFLDNFFNGFILGYVGEKCYFDFERWGEFSDNARTGVKITDDQDESKILFIIPSFTDLGLKGDDAQKLAIASVAMSGATGVQDQTRVTEVIGRGRDIIVELLGKRPTQLSDLIPEWFYEEYKVNPEIYRQMIFCRDRYGIEPNSLVWETAEQCFIRMQKGYELEASQKEFIDTLTHGEFKYPEGLVPYTRTGGTNKSSLTGLSIEQNFDEC